MIDCHTKQTKAKRPDHDLPDIEYCVWHNRSVRGTSSIRERFLCPFSAGICRQVPIHLCSCLHYPAALSEERSDVLVGQLFSCGHSESVSLS
jgi:hypothetical protein